MEVKLIVANGKHAGQKIAVSGPKFFIGRSEDCQLRPQSDLVSRHHCAIILDEGYVAVRDFGSKNGTFVNGQRVKSEQELKNGDHLTIGQLELDVELAVNVSGKKKPKVHSIQEAAARTAASGTAEELDLASWLEDGETTPVSSAHVETQTIPGTATPGKSETPEQANEEDVAEKEEEPEKHVGSAAGWKGAKRQPEGGSSREAAANVLKSLFNRH